MRISTLPTLAALAAAALLAQGTARATTVPYKDLDHLVAESDAVVVATVRQVQSVEDAQKTIHTFVTFDDLQMLGGRYDQPSLTLQLEGGRVGDHGLFIDGTPDFQPEQRVLMFVQGNGRDVVPLVGWSQGLFRLANDTQGAQVVSDAEGRAVIAVHGSHVLVDLSQGASDTNIHILGAPQAEVARHAAAPGAAGAGTTEDGSESRLVEANEVSHDALSATTFIASVKKRIAQRALSHQPFMGLKSVEAGNEAAIDPRDEASADALANASSPATPSSSQPQAPTRKAPVAPQQQ
jgi:hypothetical protein